MGEEEEEDCFVPHLVDEKAKSDVTSVDEKDLTRGREN